VRVAICQDSIISGGRLRVILGFVQALNELGIEPDIITARLKGEWEQIQEKYGLEVQANLIEIRQFTRPQDLATLFFNLGLHHYGKPYDLLINTTNSLAFLPKRKKILSYMFLPCKFRISTKIWSNHLPDIPLKAFSRRWLYRYLLKLIYKTSRPRTTHRVIAMTEFAKELLLSVHPSLATATIPIIYPPVSINKFYAQGGHRLNQIVTVGRFAPDKRQLEQIRLAQQMPPIPFHIIGFVSNEKYFLECQHYIEANDLDHVHLHPNASFGEMLELLQSSRFFLHSLINEEFGITAVQAMAAGCIPVVHDSGGQRETVPEALLRYNDLGEVPQLLYYLEDMGVTGRQELIAKLQNHILAHFDESVFVERTAVLLKSYIDSSV
jgi:glycosyltransferase involved in cell wall biosynthesis